MVKIPRWARPHTVTYKHYVGKDIHQNPQYDAPVTIKYVRMEPTSKIVLTKDNTQVQLSSLLFFDCQDSQATNASGNSVSVSFDNLDSVTFGGRDYTVLSVDTLFDKSQAPHHIEVSLI